MDISENNKWGIVANQSNAIFEISQICISVCGEMGASRGKYEPLRSRLNDHVTRQSNTNQHARNPTCCDLRLLGRNYLQVIIVPTQRRIMTNTQKPRCCCRIYVGAPGRTKRDIHYRGTRKYAYWRLESVPTELSIMCYLVESSAVARLRT